MHGGTPLPIKQTIKVTNYEKEGKKRKEKKKKHNQPKGRYLTSQKRAVHFLKLTTASTCTEAKSENVTETSRRKESKKDSGETGGEHMCDLNYSLEKENNVM